MTVSNQKRSIRYQGNDAATEFDYDFFIEEASHVEVIIYNSTNETYTTLTGGQYTITGLNDPAFGAVTYPLAGDPLSTDEYIIINRVAPYVQVMDILPQGGFHPDVLEAALDRTTRQIQQIAEIQSRSLFIVEGEGFQKRLPLRSLLVDRVLAFDENGDPTLGPTATNVDNAQGYADAAEAAKDAAETAQGAAETAQGAAEAARDAALAAVPSAFPATRTILKGYDTATITAAYLKEAGREGQFLWLAGDYSSEIASDTLEGIYIKADGVAATAGAWVRSGGWGVEGADARWFGLLADYDPGTKTGTPIQDYVNAAFAVVPWVKLPSGNMLISGQITMNGAKRLSGAGRRMCFVYANSGFDIPGSDAWVKFAGGEALHEVDAISFVAQDQPSSTNAAEYVQYPPVIDGSNMPRFKIASVHMREVWQGIKAEQNAGGIVIDDLEISMFDYGIRLNGALDSQKLSRIHVWPFGFAADSNKREVFRSAYGIYSARADDFQLNQSLLFGCRNAVYFTDIGQGQTFGNITNCDFDASGGLNVIRGDITVSACNLTLGDASSWLVKQDGGKLLMSACYLYAGVVTSPAPGRIHLLNGDFSMTGGQVNTAGTDQQLIYANNAANVALTGVKFTRTAGVSYTSALIQHLGAGSVNVVGCVANKFSSGSSTFVRIGNSATGIVANNHTPGWSYMGPIGAQAETLITNNIGAAGSEGDRFTGSFNGDATAPKLPPGWSVSRLSTGNYQVTHSLNLGSTSDLIVMPSASESGDTVAVHSRSESTINVFRIRTYTAGAAADTNVEFTAARRR